MKLLKLAFLALGVYILYITIQGVGLGTVWHQIAALKWSLLPLLAVYPIIFAFDTLGWGYAFPKNLDRKIPFGDLYLIRIIGETLNAVIPWAASLGGEPMKAELLRSRHNVPRSEALASILIVHTTFWVSLNLFVIGGIALTWETRPLTPVLWQSVLAFLVGLGLVAVFLVIGLHWGIFKRVHKIGENFKLWGTGSEEKKERFLKIDTAVKRFYASDRKRFFLSVLFNFLGWFAGTLEVYWIGMILGMNITFAEAWLYEALIQVLRIVTFFIPASIGAQEGGIVLIFQQFGFAEPVSLTFAVIRRLREALWIGFGLLIWSVLEDRPRLKRPA